MTQLKPVENLFAIEVDNEGYDFEVRKTYRTYLVYLVRGLINPLTGGEKIEQVDLPPGSYEILFTTSNAGNPDAEKICSHFELAGAKGWRDYQNRHISYPYGTALHSLQSLLRANGLDPKKNFLLIKKTT